MLPMFVCVRMCFDPPLASSQAEPWAWQESSTFTEGIPLLPPGKKLRFFFDSITARLNDNNLPRQYNVTVEYHGPIKRKELLTSSWKLDIGHYWGSSPQPKGLPELVETLGEIKKEMHKWTDGISGIRANVVDRDKEERQRYRSYRLRRAKQLRQIEGWWALAKSLVKRRL